MKYMKDGQKLPDINKHGRLTRLARSGKEPGERAKALRTVPSESGAGNLGEEDPNPVLTQHLQLKEARKERLREEGRLYRASLDEPEPTRDAVMRVIDMISKGFTGPEACEAMEISLYAFYATLGRHKDIKAAADQARLDYAHARVADMYRRVEEEPDPQKARIYADIVKWEVSKVLPKFYGDKLDVTSAGEGIKFAINFNGAAPEKAINDLSNTKQVRHDDEDQGSTTISD